MSHPVIAVVPDTPPIQLSATGDVASYFRADYARLVRSLALVCGDGDLAADAVQEAFVRAHARWRTIRHYDDPVGWMRRVALNLLRDDHRRTTASGGRSPAWPPRPARRAAAARARRPPALLGRCPASSASPSPCSTSRGSPSPRWRRRWSSPRAR